MANILVTAGPGYIGSVCCSKLLERGHRVAVVDELSTAHASAVLRGAVLHQLDIGDRTALGKVPRQGDVLTWRGSRSVRPVAQRRIFDGSYQQLRLRS